MAVGIVLLIMKMCQRTGKKNCYSNRKRRPTSK